MNNFGMSPDGSMWVISPDERASNEQSFYSIGPVKGKITGEQAHTFLLKSGLPKEVLGKIWVLSDLDQDGQMAMDEFMIAMKLITMRLKGVPVPDSLPEALRPGPGPSVGMYGGGSIPSITHQEKLRYKQQFNAHDRNRMGKITGVQARRIFVHESRLPQDVLARIWNLSDVDKDGNLSRNEFILAQHLVQSARNGILIPNILPAYLHPDSFDSSVGPAGPVNVPSPIAKDDTEELRLANYRAGQELLEQKRRTFAEEQKKALQATKDRLAAEEAKQRQIKERAAAAHDRKTERQLAEMRRKAEYEAEKQRRIMEHVEAQRLAQEQQIKHQAALMQTAIQGREQLRDQVNRMTLRLAQLNGELDGLEPRKAHLENMIGTCNKEKADASGIASRIETEHEQKALELQKVQGEYMDMENMLRQAQTERNEMSQKLIRVHHVKANKMQGTQLAKHNMGQEQFDAIKELQAVVDTGEREVTQARVNLQEYQSVLQALTMELDVKRQRKNTASAEVQVVKDHKEAVSRRVQEQQMELNEEGRLRELRENEENKKRAAAAAAQAEARGTVAQEAERAAQADQINDLATASTVTINQPVAAKTFIALYDYVGEKEEDLTFMAGDAILVTSMLDDGWWLGSCYNRSGWFPSNYVQESGDSDGHGHTATEEGEAVHTPANINVDYSYHNGSTIVPPPPSPLADIQCVTSLPRLSPEEHELQRPPHEEAEELNVPPETIETQPGNVHVALYTYESANDNDLTFQGGRYITILEAGDDGWWKGTCDGRSGWFPASYVDPIALSKTEIEEMTPMSPEHSLAAEPAEYVTAIHAYTAQIEDELSFEENDVITVLQKETDWWEGSLNGRTGWFPANYVEIGDAAGQGEQKDISLAQDNSFSESANKSEPTIVDKETTHALQKVIAKVVEAWTAEDDTQLDLKKGMLVNVTNQATDDWWEGTLSIKGAGKKTGWFPSFCVALISKPSSTTLLSNVATHVVPLATGSKSEQPKAQVWATVLFNYTAQKEDELDLIEGHKILIGQREEGGWWYGEMEGKGGWFPETYVEVDEVDTKDRCDSY